MTPCVQYACATCVVGHEGHRSRSFALSLDHVNQRSVARASLATTGLCIGVAAGLVIPALPAAAVERPVDLKSTRVFIVGDSLTVGSNQALRKQLRPVVKSVAIDARISRFTGEGIAKLRNARARQASVWVVALGTNDSPSAAQTVRNVNKVMRLAGNRRQVIWVNVVRPGGYSRVNRALQTLDAKYPRLSVIDWAAVIRKQRHLLAGDRVHLTAKGYRVRALATRQALLELENLSDS